MTGLIIVKQVKQCLTQTHSHRKTHPQTRRMQRYVHTDTQTHCGRSVMASTFTVIIIQRKLFVLLWTHSTKENTIDVECVTQTKNLIGV